MLQCQSMKTTQEIIIYGLAERDIPVLLIGGMALPAYDVVRQTMDIDCLMASSDAGVLQNILIDAGYKVEERTDNFIRFSSASVYHYDVDLLLVDNDTFKKILSDSIPFSIGHTEMSVPCIAHIIMLKIHAIKNNRKRELKDLGDIVEIIHNNSLAITDNELEEICNRYGSDDIYEKLKEAL